jgi:ankyrin repeat protein
VKNGHKTLVELALNAKADLNIQDNDGRTPLHWAAEGDRSELVELLLRFNPELNLQDYQGWTALHVIVVARSWSLKIVELLLEAGADVNMRDDHGRTVLHWAARFNSQRLVRMLLKFKTAPNIQDELGCTALHHAALTSVGFVTMELLQNAKADVNLDTNDGWTALELASLDVDDPIRTTLTELSGKGLPKEVDLDSVFDYYPDRHARRRDDSDDSDDSVDHAFAEREGGREEVDFDSVSDCYPDRHARRRC